MYQYPYGDTQQLNLDWILTKIKELEQQSAGSSIEAVANALISATYNAATQYRRYDYCFLNGKLYRCLSDTTGAFNPADWQEVLIGDDIPILTRLVNAVDASLSSLQNTVDNLDSDDIDNASSVVSGATVTDALDNLNGAITSLNSVLNVSQLSDLSGGANHFVTFTASVVVDGVTIPQHSKGVLTASSANDATLYVIDTQGNIYTAFRNNGTWKVGNKKITQITNADMQNNWQTNGLCYLMRTNDEIHLHASIRNGTTTDGTVILSFPDYKPIIAINTPIFNVVNKTLNGYALATENGNISIYGVTNASYAIFDLFWTI